MKKILLLSLAVMLLCWSMASAVNPTTSAKNSVPSKATQVIKGEKVVPVQEAVGDQPITAIPVTKVEQPAQTPAAEPATMAPAKPVIQKQIQPKAELKAEPSADKTATAADFRAPSTKYHGPATMPNWYSPSMTLVNIMPNESFETGALPAGWTDSPGTYPWQYDGGADHGPGVPNSGSYAAYFDIWTYSSGATEDLKTPSFTFTGAGYILTFWGWHSSGTDYVDVYFDDGVTQTFLYTMPNTTAWTQHVVSFNASTAGMIVFKGYSYYGNYNLYIDDVSIDEAPSVGRCCYGNPTAPSCLDNSQPDCDLLGGTWNPSFNCVDDPCPVMPVGDICAYPIVISSFPYQDIQNTAGFANDYNGHGNDVVYQFTIAERMLMDFTLCNTVTPFDTWMGIWADGYCGTTTFVTYNDDDACPSSGVLSNLPGVTLEAGTYYLLVESYSSALLIDGAYTLDITAVPAPQAPWNDECTAVTPVALVADVSVQFTGDNTGATIINDCPSFPTYPDVWIAFTVPECMDVTLDFCGTTPAWGNTWLNLAIECPCTGFTPGASFEATTCPPNFTLTWTSLQPGVNYYFPIMLDPADGAGPGPYIINVVGHVCPPPPPPDYFVTAPGTWSSTTCGAGFDCSLNASSEDEIYEVTIPYDGVWTFSLCNTSPTWDSWIALGTTSCLDDIAFNDDGCAPLSIITVALTAADGPYYLTIEGYGTNCGAYTLDIFEAPPPPWNDECTAVTPVELVDGVSVQFTGDNTGATIGNDCYAFTSYPNVWHAFTVPECMNVTLDYCGTTPAWGDAWLNLALDCPCTGFTPAGSWETTTCPDGNVTIRWSMLQPGVTYYFPVMLDPAYGAGPGPYVLNVVGTVCPPPPDNDNCVDATPGGLLTPGVPIQFTGTNAGATVDCPDLGYREAWVKFSTDVCQDIVIDYCGTDPVFNNIFIVMTDACPCNPIFIRAASWAQSCPDGNWSEIFYGVQPGEYWYPILTDAGAEGPYVINVTGTECPPPPENDYCAQAIAIGDVTDLPWQTRSATFDGAGACMTSPNIWYTYTASCDGVALISTCGSELAAMLAVYDGTTCPDAPILPDPVALQGGEDCANAMPIPGPLPAVYTGTTVGYADTYTPSCVYGASPDIVYSYAPTADQIVDVTLCGTSHDTGLIIFEDVEGNEIACNDDYCGLQSGIIGVNMQASHVYFIVVDGYNGSSGAITLNMIATDYTLLGCSSYSCGTLNGAQLAIPVTTGQQLLIEIGGSGTAVGNGILTTSCSPPPENDLCANATPIGDVDLLPFSTITAGFDGNGICQTAANVWYLYTASCDGNATISLCGSAYDTKLAVYDGASCDPLGAELACNDDFCGLQSMAIIPVVTGNQYLIEVGGFSSNVGDGVLTVSCALPPPDYCATSVYNNGPATGFAYASQCAPLYPFAAEVADDFILPGVGTITIDTVVAYFNFWNGTGTPDIFAGVAVTIYANDAINSIPDGTPIDGDPACGHQETNPGGIISTQAIPFGSFAWEIDVVTGNYRLILPIADVNLDAGTTYWLGVAPQMEFPPQCGWVNTDIVTGVPALQIFAALGIPNWTDPGGVDMAFCLIQRTPAPPVGTISGTVTDGLILAPIQDVAIVTYDVDNNVVGNSLSSPTGTWTLDLTPGTYHEHLTKAGYNPTDILDIVVTGSTITNVNAVMVPVGGCHYVVGDANGNAVFNGLDVTYSVGYFKGGPPPPYSCACPPPTVWYVSGDVNASCNFNGLDVTYMVAWFKGGPACHPCALCPPTVDILVAPKPVNLQNSGQ